MHYHLTVTKVTPEECMKIADVAYPTKAAAYQSLPKHHRPNIATMRHWRRGDLYFDVSYCGDTHCLIETGDVVL